jgi:hypothetical protein
MRRLLKTPVIAAAATAVLGLMMPAAASPASAVSGSAGSASSSGSAAAAARTAAADAGPPTITAGFAQSTAQPVGTTLTFTIAQSATDTHAAKKFVWGLDQEPPTAGTIPAAQTCTTTAATTACTKISGGQATLKITVPSPGPHNLWVYEQDTAGNDSEAVNGAPAGMTTTFTGAGDRRVTYTSDASLAANFAAAVTAGGNTIISSTALTSCGASSGNGSGGNFDAANLKNAGWDAGQAVTVDGATFTLPSYGSCGPDNLLAANQEIGTGSAGAQGSALVFLATSTSANVQVPGLVSGSPDSGVLASDATAPAVAGGTSVPGSGCSGAAAFGSGCVPASGTISYASGCGDGNQTAYDLTAPDWQTGPSDIAAVALPQVVTTSGLSTQMAKIYAFAVPVDASCTVTSVGRPRSPKCFLACTFSAWRCATPRPRPPRPAAARRPQPQDRRGPVRSPRRPRTPSARPRARPWVTRRSASRCRPTSASRPAPQTCGST